MRKLHSKTLVKENRDSLFEFFCNAENLAVLSPPWLRFEIVTPTPIEMEEGKIIDYKLKIHGIPIKWRTEITEWNPPFSFTDVQLIGPYSTWIHQHKFEEVDEGVLMHDLVQFKSPGWFLEPIVHKLFVKNDLIKIFRYRIEEFSKKYNVLEQSLEIDGERIQL
jgi:ligand-binding SRPBCC domain-containing protein